MTFTNRPALAGMLATILLASSAGLSAAGEAVPGPSASRAETASAEALSPARYQQMSQAEYEQYMTCLGRMESGIAAMKVVRSRETTTEFDEMISAADGQILPVAIQFAVILDGLDWGLDTAAGKSARRAGRDVFDSRADDPRALAFNVRNILVMTPDCLSVFEMAVARIP